MIRVGKLCVRVGAFALNEISFEIAAGDYAVLMGRTGSGKTTLLETLCGLRPVASGRIFLSGEDVTEISPAARGIGYVPQDRALFHSMSVRENLTFGLKIRGTNAATTSQRVNELAELLGLTALLDRQPHHLSGGEAQRVALGRALATQPRVLCLDEPLSGLDDDTRAEMHALLHSVHERTHATILHVTHHVTDARKLADKLFVLRNGRIERSDPGALGS